MRKLLKRFLLSLALPIVIFLAISFRNNTPSQELLQSAQKAQKTFQASITNSGYSILIDFNKPVFTKRLWLLDSNHQVVLHCHMSHAWRSGFIYANKLSNTPQSNLSSTGAFVTLNKYQGQFGESMRINGLEKGSNNNVYQRNIVFHPSVKLRKWGISLPQWLSWYTDGCFASTDANMKLLVDKANGGAFVYVLKTPS